MRTTKAQLEQIINDRTRQFEEQRLVAIALQTRVTDLENRQIRVAKLEAAVAIAHQQPAVRQGGFYTDTERAQRRAAMSSAREAAILSKRVVLVSPK